MSDWKVCFCDIVVVILSENLQLLKRIYHRSVRFYTNRASEILQLMSSIPLWRLKWSLFSVKMKHWWGGQSDVADTLDVLQIFRAACRTVEVSGTGTVKLSLEWTGIRELKEKLAIRPHSLVVYSYWTRVKSCYKVNVRLRHVILKNRFCPLSLLFQTIYPLGIWPSQE